MKTLTTTKTTKYTQSKHQYNTQKVLNYV